MKPAPTKHHQLPEILRRGLMVQQGQIDHLLQETGQIEPSASLVQQAFLQDYEGAYRESMDAPERFWEGVASELEWTRRWDSVFPVGLPHLPLVPGGEVQHNAERPGPPLDQRQPEQGRLHLAGRRRHRARLHLRTAGATGQPLRQRAALPGRGQGRPRGHLYAAHARGRHCHAGLRPHRRGT